MVWNGFLIRGRCGNPGPPGINFIYLFYRFYYVSCFFGHPNRTIKLGVCEGSLHFLECFIVFRLFVFSDVPGGVTMMTISCYSLYAKMFLNSFCWPWRLLGLLGGSLGSLLFLASLWTLFHRFGRCSNHDDFLLEFIIQSAPKLVLVTLEPFGPPWGMSCSPLWLHKIWFHWGLSLVP